MEDLRIKIPNHFSPQLSELDLLIVRSVPPGGNWKNIPESIPSQRLQQIRDSFAAGEGSRSTYYGRLRADAPSYTINTYISRPGNGCHIHYDYNGGQHRVLSQREAARLQSFPDSFLFTGSRNAVNQQIGNAVPPLLAYQIAKTIPFKGRFVDLFCGAGGLALGFIWAGWHPIVANDVVEDFSKTYSTNIHDSVVTGDIREETVFNKLVEYCEFAKREAPSPLFVLGGPPCQGFSTAGNRRTMDDERNWLFRAYRKLLEVVQPTGFVFENVPGLLNMEGGRVFDLVRQTLQARAKTLHVWKLSAESYGVPQRRTRVILIGSCTNDRFVEPSPITIFGRLQPLFEPLSPAITVEQALSDLPPLNPGEDGSFKEYLHEPSNDYQRLMRGQISPEEYLHQVEISSRS